MNDMNSSIKFKINYVRSNLFRLRMRAVWPWIYDHFECTGCENGEKQDSKWYDDWLDSCCVTKAKRWRCMISVTLAFTCNWVFKTCSSSPCTSAILTILTILMYLSDCWHLLQFSSKFKTFHNFSRTIRFTPITSHHRYYSHTLHWSTVMQFNSHIWRSSSFECWCTCAKGVKRGHGSWNPNGPGKCHSIELDQSCRVNDYQKDVLVSLGCPTLNGEQDVQSCFDSTALTNNFRLKVGTLILQRRSLHSKTRE